MGCYMEMAKGIVLIGGGGHCLSVIDALTGNNDYDDIVITDNEATHEVMFHGYKIIGNDSLLPDLFRKGYKEAFITIGSIKRTERRRKIYIRAKECGFSFPSIYDMSAAISIHSEISSGVFVGKNAIVNSFARIGKFAIINSGAIIEHECNIGDFTHVAVGAVVCGGCNIGNDVFIGANSTIIQGVNIGMNSIIGAGSLVLSNVPENTRVLGVWGGCKD